MMDLKSLSPEIETKLIELMEARGWTRLGDMRYHSSYRKDDMTINVNIRAVYSFLGSRYPDGYRAKLSGGGLNRSFAVGITKASSTNVGFTIDERKLDRKIEEVCAMMRERQANIKRCKEERIEVERKAAEFAAGIQEILPTREVTPSGTNSARISLPGGTVIVARKQNGSYSCVLNCTLFALEDELPALIKSLAEHS